MMEMARSFLSGLLAAAAGLLSGIAVAQESSLGDVMRARMQARVEAQGRIIRERSPERAGRAADNGAWQRADRAQPQDRGEWHRADRPVRLEQQPATREDADRRPADRPGAGSTLGERPDRVRPGVRRGDRGEWRNRDDASARGRNRRWTARDWASARYQRSRDERAWYERSDFEDRRDWNWRSDDARGWARDWGSGNGGGWDRGWRRSERYDWNRYRASNRAAYRLPRYYAPAGWSGGYRRFALGARLSSPLFARGYWIEDPYAYRLPDAYEPYRWVRYYNDALLVDLDTGQVVDTIYDIFW